MRNHLRALLAAAALLTLTGATLPRVLADPAAPPVVAGTAEKTLTAEQVKALIDKLAAEDFKTRTAARKDLVAAGPPALAALEQASHATDPEVAAQARGAIQDIRRAMAAATTDALAKNHLWCYPMEKGAAWVNAGAWPVIHGQTAYVVGNDAQLHAVDIKTGKARWTADLTVKPAAAAGGAAVAVPMISIVTQLSAGEKYLALVRGMNLTVAETKDGKLLWDKDFQPAAPAGPGNLPLGPAGGQGAGAAGGQGAGAAAGNGPAPAPAPGPAGQAAGGIVAHPGAIVAGKLSMAFARPEAWVVGDLVVVRTDNLTAYKAQNGAQAWQIECKPGARNCPSAFADPVLYVSTEQSVAAIDLTAKNQLWKKEMPACAKLLVAGGTVVCLAGNKIVALDAKNGDSLWEAQPIANAPAANGPGAGANVPPAAMNRPAMINGALLSLKIAADQTRLYVVDRELLTSYDLKTGARLEATLDIGEEKAGNAAATSTTVIQPGPGGGAAVMVSAPLLKVAIIRLAAADGKLYGVANTGIYAFDAKTAAPLWTLPLTRMLPTEPVVVDGVLYFATSANMAFRGQGGFFGNVMPQPAAPQPAPADPAPKDQAGLHALKLPT